MTNSEITEKDIGIMWCGDHNKEHCVYIHVEYPRQLKQKIITALRLLDGVEKWNSYLEFQLSEIERTKYRGSDTHGIIVDLHARLQSLLNQAKGDNTDEEANNSTYTGRSTG